MDRKLRPIGLTYFIILLTITQVVDAQEKITGPWLWMIAPTKPGRGGADSIHIDSLAVASRSAVTETDVARNGANVGDRVGNYVWTLGEISPVGHNNVNECLNRIGLSRNTNIDDHSSYALITLKSATAQSGVAMRVGSDDAIKVWLNGKVVHNNPVNRGAFGYQEEFLVDLEVGDNLLMVKVSEAGSDWSMFVGINANVTAGNQHLRFQSKEMIQLIYFLPSDRQPQRNIDAKLDGLIKASQQFYAEQMEAHGFGRKTFQFETDRTGNAVVHHINGKFTDAYYQTESWDRAWSEVEKHFSSSNIYILALDVSVDTFCGVSSDQGLTGGRVLVPASGFCLNVRTITHELGHTFGLAHDFRNDAYRMSYGEDSDRLSACAAEWLDVHRYFNTYPTRAHNPTEIEMLRSPSSPPNPMHLRFEVSDPDGLHQFQLLSPDATEDLKLLDCKRLNGKNETIEFITSKLSMQPGPHLTVRVIDVWGNSVEQTYRNYINITNPINKIRGPWLWMIAPTKPGRGGADSIHIDSLAVASRSAVTETDVARNGANVGDKVGNYVWTLGEISDTGLNNIGELINRIGLSTDKYIDDHSSYALIMLESATVQLGVPMRVGSDDAIKVWLNGEIVHENPINRGATDFQDTFKVDLQKGNNPLLVKVSQGIVDWSMFVGIDANFTVNTPTPRKFAEADVNSDGVVNIRDLVLVASNFGQTGQNPTDVNGDGIINIIDLVMVSNAFGDNASAAPALHSQVSFEGLTPGDVQHLLTQLRQMALTDPTYAQSIAVLEKLLVHLLPKRTALLPNYPNPFNPETWIPYQLSKPVEVTLHIYTADGTLIRTLALGYQPAGVYQSKGRAAYWDGRNELGERVASGVYFYTLSAGESTATRKMLILK